MGRIEKNRKGVKEEGGGGGGGDRNARNSVYSHLLHKSLTTKRTKKNDIGKQLSKEAIRQGKLREVTKCLLTQFSKLQVEL